MIENSKNSSVVPRTYSRRRREIHRGLHQPNIFVGKLKRTSDKRSESKKTVNKPLIDLSPARSLKFTTPCPEIIVSRCFVIIVEQERSGKGEEI